MKLQIDANYEVLTKSGSVYRIECTGISHRNNDMYGYFSKLGSPFSTYGVILGKDIITTRELQCQTKTQTV